MVNAMYTVVLNNLVESGFDLGLNKYPIWDSDYRAILNKKIIDHYRFREIGFETPAMFRFYLTRTMDEIMPYYNQLYQTTIYKYNPIHNVDYQEEYTIDKTNTNDGVNNTVSKGSTEGSGTANVKTTNKSDSSNSTRNEDAGKAVEIDTPQGRVNLSTMNTESELVASKVNLNKNSANGSGTAHDESEGNTVTNDTTRSSNTNDTTNTMNMNGSSTEKYLRKLHGNYGVKTSQSMIQEERDLIINIDMMIVNELESLFMQLW